MKTIFVKVKLESHHFNSLFYKRTWVS